MKNTNKLLEFSGYMDYLCTNHKKVWNHVNPDGAYTIDASKLASFCLKVKHQYTKGGVWDLDSENMEGLWEPFHELLCKIGFPFNKR